MVEDQSVKHFTYKGKHYLISFSQVRVLLFCFNLKYFLNMSQIATDIIRRVCLFQLFVWTGGSFTLLQTFDFTQRILSVVPFTRGQVPYLLVCIDRQTDSCLLLERTSGRFENPKPLKLTGRAIQAEAINTRTGDTLLLVLVESKIFFYCPFDGVVSLNN